MINYKTNQRITIVDRIPKIERNYQLGEILSKIIRDSFFNRETDFLSYDIFKSLPPAIRVPAALQILFTLRLSEVAFVDLEALMSGVSQIILQSKTKSIKRLRPLPISNYIRPIDIDCNFDIFLMNHTSYILTLQKFIPENVIDCLKTEANKSHVFRHLKASFLKSKNFSPEVIKETLGHNDLNSQKSYIHDSLILLFSNTY